MKLSLYYRYYIIMIVSLMMVIIIYSCESNRHISAKEAAYIAEIEEWHAKRIERLKSKTGWLSLAGLYWFDQNTRVSGPGANGDSRPWVRVPLQEGLEVLFCPCRSFLLWRCGHFSRHRSLGH